MTDHAAEARGDLALVVSGLTPRHPEPGAEPMSETKPSVTKITMTCSRCKASITDDWEHIQDWDRRHDTQCPKKAKR